MEDEELLADGLSTKFFSNNQYWTANFPFFDKPEHKDLILAYFSQSHWYDRACFREYIVNTVGVDNMAGQISEDRLQALFASFKGIHFTVDWEVSKPPHFFVIRKELVNGKISSTLKAIYYVADGFIFQAPSAHDFSLARIAAFRHHATEAQAALSTDQEWDPLEGFTSKAERKAALSNQEGDSRLIPTFISQTAFQKFVHTQSQKNFKNSQK